MLGFAGVVLSILIFLFAPNGDAGNGMAGMAGATQIEAAEPPPPDIFKEEIRPFVQKYCGDCHNADDPEGGIDVLAFASEDDIVKGAGRKSWEKILTMIEIGAMPPIDAEQPSLEDREKHVAWLEDKLFNLDCEMIDDPGRVTVRRLNRAEYNNTVRDLLGVEFKPADDFPSDDVGYGFDNIGDVLSLSPLLMEKYLDAAEAITRDALPIPNDGPVVFGPAKMKTEPRVDVQGGFFTLASRAVVTLEYDAPSDGEYTISIRAKAQQHGPDPARMKVQIDGKDARIFDVTGQMKPSDYQHTMRLTPGRHRITADFINDFYEANKGDRNLYVGTFGITPPPVRTALHDFITARPDENRSVVAAAAETLKPFVTKAFRRPATNEEAAKFASIVEMVTEDGGSFDEGIQVAVQAVLVSPSFLFRIETDATPDDPMADRAVTDYEIASRLSYFLWSTMPDAELFDLAAKGELRKPEILDRQVTRMLADQRSQALVNNFAEQWLNLRMLDEVSPDPAIFPDFDEELRGSMKRESLLLFETVMRDNRSILDFLDADFSYVNERLAKHYGIDLPRNSGRADGFYKVSLNPQQRAGVLTHASILTLTSNPDRTSPVKRGKWIMENILGKEPPTPPPGVPELEETKKAAPNLSMRQQLERHRADPGCAVCHTTMDTIGFGFENFDATGRWRDRDNDQPVDASGKLPTGDAFNGPTELVKILKRSERDFARTLTDRMLTYGLGRGLHYYDRCAIDEILKRLEQNNYRFPELIRGIVHSKPFLKRRGDGERT